MNEIDPRILERAYGGDQGAKINIIEHFRGLIINHSKRYGGAKTFDEDLFQEGVEQILIAIKNYEKEKGVPFGAYGALLLKNYYRNRRRKEKYHYYLNAFVSGEEGTTFGDLLADDSINIEEDYSYQEQNRELGKALGFLTNYQRQVIEDYYFKEISLKEIARKRGVHYITVVKAKARALEKIKKVISHG